MITKEEILSHFIKTTRNGIYTANRLIQNLHAIFNKGIEWGLCDKNPCIGIKKHKEKSRDRYVDTKEMNIFLKTVEEEPNKMIADFFLTCLYTGARKGNVLSMKWENINFKDKMWYVPDTKNGEPQNVPLDDIAIEVLNRRKENNSTKWVFPSELSASGHLEEPKKVWHRIVKKAGIRNLRIHDLRRTLGSWMANNGETLHVIGGTLGHKSPSSTRIYSRLHINSMRKGVKGAINNMNGKNKEGRELSIEEENKEGKESYTQELIKHLIKQNTEISKQMEEIKKEMEELKKETKEAKKRKNNNTESY